MLKRLYLFVVRFPKAVLSVVLVFTLLALT